MKKGFTLIEMLGIIAVLAVVLLVTFPVLNNSLKKMQEDKNKNFMNNLKISAEAYAQTTQNNSLKDKGSITITIKDLYEAGLLKGQNNIDMNDKIIVTKKEDGTLRYYYVDVKKIKQKDFNYTGNQQEYTVQEDGIYQIEMWGAQGGSYCYSQVYNGGSYTSGNIILSAKTKLYIYVGQSTNTQGLAAYNGGGIGYASNYGNYGENGAYSGGGATDVRLNNGNWDNFNSLKSRIMVAAAGSGRSTSGPSANCSTSSEREGKPGGGLLGYGISDEYGGKQTTGGSCIYSNYCTPGSFGKGGNSIQNNHANGGGGGGYYGGAAETSAYQQGVSGLKGGGSGSSFISGHNGCDAISQESTENNIIHTGQNIHYSGLYFTETTMIDGKGCIWTEKLTTNCPGIPKPDKTGIEMGHSGNGYARITYLGNEI